MGAGWAPDRALPSEQYDRRNPVIAENHGSEGLAGAWSRRPARDTAVVGLGEPISKPQAPPTAKRRSRASARSCFARTTRITLPRANALLSAASGAAAGLGCSPSAP